ncbi:hypothetical protein [Nonomuraea sp. NPDC049725]|uniref:hypothetical protein n=1 Tax=Nonomuraea sp. NPDC049725 TaxID=3154508 RepID=UPI00341AD4F8
MRSRLPAALLLLLSWFLPATGHAQLTIAAAADPAAVSAGQAAVAGDPGQSEGRHEDQHGARRSPYQPPTAYSWTASYDATGGQGPVVLPADAQAPGRPRADVVRRAGGAEPVVLLTAATPARAPPSTGL